MADRLLDRALLTQAFNLLASKLQRRGVVGEVHVFGGAAMVLVFNSRVATRDVDAVFLPDGPMLEAAAEVSRELDLPRSWLNNQASSYVSTRPGRGVAVYDHPHLRVLATPLEHLFAMKVRAAREGDVPDLRLLIDKLQPSSFDAVVAIVRTYFPDEPLSDRSRLLLEDLLAEGRRAH